MPFSNGEDCASLFQTTDWSKGPLGPADTWPVELKTLANVMIGSLQPILIVWGPDQITLYNDGYAAMCGNRHPKAFGRPFKELWHDIWDQVNPIISAAYAGQGTAMDDIAFVMHRKGFPEEAHFSFSYTPVRDPWGSVLGMFCACNEITSEVMAKRAQASERERFLQVFELSHGGIALLSGPNHIFEYANNEYYSMIGLGREIIGRSVVEAVPEVVRQGFIDILDQVYRTGEAFVAKDLPIELNRGSAGEKQDRIIDLVYQAMRSADGRIEGILVQARDVTEANVERKHQELLSHELGHRLKNQLAMVQAIVSQTLRSAEDVRSARTQVGQRIRVLSEAHDLILEEGRGSSTVDALVAVALALHNDPNRPRIVAAGPRLLIGSRPSLSLSLIIHELATNALKHGSLSRPEGRVDLSWGVAGRSSDRFEMIWKESGGPLVTAPQSEGTGTRLIQAGLLGTSDCRVHIGYRPSGLECIVSAELVGFQREH